jgi:guanosine-3',5'-bis(diphosphate) 3'-pyrophosphohydrolase
MMKKLEMFRVLIREIILENLDDAQILSQYAHRGQKRRSGEPYFFHPQGVADIVKKYYPNDQAAYYTALLHDAIEDGIPLGNFEDEEEFAAFLSSITDDDKLIDDVFNAVGMMTKHKNASYESYIGGLLGNDTVLKVKISDMMHNLSDAPSPHQMKKYSNAYQQLLGTGIPKAISQAHWAAFEDIIKNV